MRAKLRKHWVAFAALLAFHFVFFFPVLFMGRVISPNDVFYNYEPWATHKPPSLSGVQNSLLNDPATAYYPLFSLLRRGWETFHWNPYIGGGIPGFGSSGSAVLTPFVLFPALTVPMSWIYTALIFLKLNVAFWFAYAWLREEGVGREGAAIGALVASAAGVYSVRWLWQSTNATALYPALLWIIRRTFCGRRTPLWLVGLIAIAYALAGFPSTMAYGAYLCLAYVLFLMFRERRLPLRTLGLQLAAVILALIITAPSLVPFAQFIRRSGYLPLRESITTRHFPLSHWLSFIDPQRLGNPALKDWKGDAALLGLNNFVEATIFVGVVTLALAPFVLVRRRLRSRWFWIVSAALIVLVIFGITPLYEWIGRLPGFRYTPVARAILLLPIPAAYLAAGGASALLGLLRRWRRSVAATVAAALAVLVAAELGVFAGRFHPYLKPVHATPPQTAVTDFLRDDPQPYRFVAFLTYLWPNSAELYEIEDTASHFGSEADYRRLLTRVDPSAWGGTSTVIQFNSLQFQFTDPLVSMLGVRYFLEHRNIDIIKWTTFAATTPGLPERAGFQLAPGRVLQRTIAVNAEPFWAIELPVSVEEILAASPRLDVELWKGGGAVWTRSFPASDIQVMNKVYIPMRSFARQGESVALRVWARGMRVGLLGAEAAPGEDPFFYGRVTIPLIFDRQLPEGRVFRNLAEVPRFLAVKRLRKMNDAEFLATRDIDFQEEAVITDDPVFPPAAIDPNGQVQMVRYAPAQQELRTQSAAPLFLASSEKLTPELRVTIDGRAAKAIEINTLFAGVVVPAGEHRVVFSRRIGRGWWIPSLLASLMLLALSAWEINAERRRRRTDRRRVRGTSASAA